MQDPYYLMDPSIPPLTGFGAIMHEHNASREQRRFDAACAAMQGLLVAGKFSVNATPRIAVETADALLAELERTK